MSATLLPVQSLSRKDGKDRPSNNSTLFTLPSELRLLIWQHCMTSRTITIEIEEDTRRRDFKFLVSLSVPTMIHICGESRRYALAQYHLNYLPGPFYRSEHNPSAPPCSFYFFDHDILFFERTKSFVFLFEPLSDVTTRPSFVEDGASILLDWPAVKRVAICHSLQDPSDEARRLWDLSSVFKVKRMFGDVEEIVLVLYQDEFTTENLSMMQVMLRNVYLGAEERKRVWTVLRGIKSHFR